MRVHGSKNEGLHVVTTTLQQQHAPDESRHAWLVVRSLCLNMAMFACSPCLHAPHPVSAPFAIRVGDDRPGFLNYDAWHRAGFVDPTNPRGLVDLAMGFIAGASESAEGMVVLQRDCPFHLGMLTKLKVIDLSANNLRGAMHIFFRTLSCPGV